MYNLVTAVVQDHQNEQNIEGGCRNSEKINRALTRMVFEESPPGLGWLCIRRTPRHQVRDGSFGNLEPQPEHFPMNSGRTPA